MAVYIVTHPDLPPEIDAPTVETRGGREAALKLAAAHVAAILRHRGLLMNARPEDVAAGVSVEEVS